MKVYLYPDFGDQPDPGDGGVRRVVEAQRRHLPAFGFDVVDDPAKADLLAAHITAPPQLINRWAGKPLVAHNHGFYWSEFGWGEWARKDNAEVMRLIKAANVTTAPSEWVARIIRRHTCRDVRTIYHGIEPDDWKGGAEPPNVVEGEGLYGLWNKTRIDPICDPSVVKMLAGALPDVPFITTFMPEGTSVPENVQVTGKQPYEIAKGLVAGAGFYLATARETFGIGTLEALAAGVPIVGWRWGGQAEIVTHRFDGYLAEPGDYDDLARGVIWALGDGREFRQTRRDTFGGPEWSWQAKVGQYAELYRELIEEAQRARPRVSIIVTAYNLARFLPETLASVQTQTAKDWECIVVDDASPDECGAIADQVAAADPRFKVVHNDTNQYLAEARNTGIRASSGRYILPLDADDRLAPTAVAQLAGALDGDRGLHVAYGGVTFTKEDGQLETYPGREPGRSGWPVQFDLGLMMRGPGQPMPYASMFRRDAWRLTGGYRRRVRSSEDCDLWLRLSSYGFTAMMVTPSPTLIYRNRTDSMSRTEGWADAENRRWFPWSARPELMPAGARDGPLLDVSLLDPSVAVIIPCGPGHEQLVRDAVDSVDAQTFRAWECIVANDTGHDLPELPSWVRQVRTAGKAGVAQARNAAILRLWQDGELGRVSHFLPLDADDFLLPRALEQLAAAALEDPGAVFYPDFWEDPEEPGVFRVYHFADYDPQLIKIAALHAVTALTPRGAWEKVSGYDPNLPWEDWDFQLKLADVGVCSRRVARPLWVYRKHTGHRRNDIYTKRREASAAMLTRWGDVVQGRRELMACQSCAKGRTIAGLPQTPQVAVPAVQNGAVLIRYLGEARGDQAFRGKVTGRVYYFGGLSPLKYVMPADVEGFLATGFFEQPPPPAELAPTLEPDAPELAAPGPPRRKAKP